MASKISRKRLALRGLEEFLDYTEWIGRLPSAKSNDIFERRWAFKFIHLKQARQKCSTCIWYPEFDEILIKRGYSILFSVDARMIRKFDFTGREINGLKVIEKVGEKNLNNQTMWICTDVNGAFSTTLAYNLIRSEQDCNFPKLEKNHHCMIDKDISCWKLLGFVSVGNINDIECTYWNCSKKNDKANEVYQVCLPSLPNLKRYIDISLGKSVLSIQDFQRKQGVLLGGGVDDLTNQNFGRWKVVAYSNRATNNECV